MCMMPSLMINTNCITMIHTSYDPYITDRAMRILWLMQAMCRRLWNESMYHWQSMYSWCDWWWLRNLYSMDNGRNCRVIMRLLRHRWYKSCIVHEFLCQNHRVVDRAANWCDEVQIAQSVDGVFHVLRDRYDSDFDDLRNPCAKNNVNAVYSDSMISVLGGAIHTWWHHRSSFTAPHIATLNLHESCKINEDPS